MLAVRRTLGLRPLRMSSLVDLPLAFAPVLEVFARRGIVRILRLGSLAATAVLVLSCTQRKRSAGQQTGDDGN